MTTAYRRVTSADADLLADFLTASDWPFHGSVPDRDEVHQTTASGRYDGDDEHAFLITGPEGIIGLVRVWDLADPGALFDLRIAAAHRGHGHGTAALTWLTANVFSVHPGISRIEGTTRQDNTAMRRTFLAAGYQKEAHYREAWPAQDGGMVHDAVGYAILRRDWQDGTVTPVRWDDEPAGGR